MSQPIDKKVHFICLDNIFFVVDILLKINYYDYSSFAGVWLFKILALNHYLMQVALTLLDYYYHDPYGMSGVFILEGGWENRK
jgi:hypothetical protein